MMMQYARQYEQTQVVTSSGVQLVVLLYDAAIQSMEMARREIQEKNVREKARHLGRAIAIIGELNSVLDLEQGGEIARSLRRLYDYMLIELVEANARNNEQKLESPLRCLSTLREAWREVANQQQPRLVGTR
ncbi:MAG: flagellar export chaperone FliS [Nitrospira sp.]|nr:flagellar export chaperone FliS [Nitrospira sp.]